MNPDMIVVNVKLKPDTGEIGIGSNLPQDLGVVGRLAMQQVLHKASVALDQAGRKPQNNIILPEPVVQ